MRGKTKNVAILGAASLALLFAGSALAADAPVITKAPPKAAPPPSPVFELAFGASISTDYNFRGISQSNRDWSGGGYLEGRYNSAFGQWYLGTAAWRIDWPTSIGFSDPSAEVNFTGGWRHSWDKASVDIGVIYYYYPGESFGIDSDFWEIYWKGGYAVNDKFSVGLNLFYTPDLLNYGSILGSNIRGLYGALTASYKFWEQGDWSGAVSGELGHWWLRNNPGFAKDPDYTYWNAGIAWTYKSFTLDLRYHGSDLSAADCGNFLLVGSPHPSNRWCKDAYIATLKFDMTLPN